MGQDNAGLKLTRGMVRAGAAALDELEGRGEAREATVRAVFAVMLEALLRDDDLPPLQYANEAVMRLVVAQSPQLPGPAIDEAVAQYRRSIPPGCLDLGLIDPETLWRLCHLLE